MCADTMPSLTLQAVATAMRLTGEPCNLGRHRWHMWHTALHGKGKLWHSYSYVLPLNMPAHAVVILVNVQYTHRAVRPSYNDALPHMHFLDIMCCPYTHVHAFFSMLTTAASADCCCCCCLLLQGPTAGTPGCKFDDDPGFLACKVTAALAGCWPGSSSSSRRTVACGMQLHHVMACSTSLWVMCMAAHTHVSVSSQSCYLHLRMPHLV
jgi:hypothetical protein